MSYAAYREQNNNISEIEKKLKKLEGNDRSNFNDLDETYWTPKHVGGDEMKGEAIIRFLPNPPSPNGGQESDAIVKYHTYTLSKNDKHYIQRGRDSLGPNQQDPAVEYNIPIWKDNSLTKEQKIAKIAQKKVFYIANIYVVKDPKMPENEGKVFRFQFGPQIYNMIRDSLFPEFETQKKVIVYDPENGADFYLRVTSKKVKEKTIPTYESSKFAEPSKRWDVMNGEFDKIWDQEYSLQSEISEDKYLPYEDLKVLFDRVANGEVKSKEPVKRDIEHKTKDLIEDDLPESYDSEDSLFEEIENQEVNTTSNSSNDDDDWFKNL